MMELATGVDLIEVKRIQEAIERHGDPFLKRIFTTAELAEAGDSPASLAARFAAKEATAKALGCGIGTVRWQEVEVLRDAVGKPQLYLHGAAAQLATERGLTTWSISLSHTQEHAIAMVVGAG